MSDKPKYSAAELVQKAEEYVTVCELELAHKFYTRALELEPENTSIMDDTAQVLLDMGEPEEAAELLAKSITLAPRSGFLKYLNMAQLLEGRDSLNSYNTAVQIMLEDHETALKNHEGNDKLASLKKEISRAYCAMAELFLTDLCMEEDADKEGDRLVSLALEWDQSAEPYLLRAQILLSLTENNRALTALLTSLLFWMNKGLTAEELPPFAVRYTSGKLLIELEQFEKAAEVFEFLTQEEDENAEIWYLLGFSFSKSDATLGNAEECLTRALQLIESQGEPAPGAKQQIEDVLNQVQEKLSQLPEEDGNGEDDGEEGSEDEDEKM